jgi:hypothetical protein
MRRFAEGGRSETFFAVRDLRIAEHVTHLTA